MTVDKIVSIDELILCSSTELQLVISVLIMRTMIIIASPVGFPAFVGLISVYRADCCFTACFANHCRSIGNNYLKGSALMISAVLARGRRRSQPIASGLYCQSGLTLRTMFITYVVVN